MKAQRLFTLFMLETVVAVISAALITCMLVESGVQVGHVFWALP